jgi:hypothetical protein
MKNRLSPNSLFPPLFNLGLHQAKKPVLLPWGNFSQYKRKTETLENPIRKSLRLTELVRVFWALFDIEVKIAVINTDQKQAFSYEDWFAGTNVNCYEEPWIPGFWSNPLLKNQTPDLVILLSIDSADRITVLNELQSLRLPVLNFSGENISGHQFILPDLRNFYSIHFYMEIIRFLLLHSQELQIAFHSISDETGTEEKDFYAQILNLIRRYQKEQSEVTSSSLWFRPDIYKIHSGKKKLISLKRKKLYVKRCIKTRHPFRRM